MAIFFLTFLRLAFGGWAFARPGMPRKIGLPKEWGFCERALYKNKG
jgi:hypothetical protein